MTHSSCDATLIAAKIDQTLEMLKRIEVVFFLMKRTEIMCYKHDFTPPISN